MLVILLPFSASGDIYRFVDVDGVEIFTDTPRNKNAKKIITESNNTRAKKPKNVKAQKTHTISLDEIAHKTVQNSIAPAQTSNKAPAPFGPVLADGSITSGVGMRIDPIDGKFRQHNGIDIAVREGTPVKAAADGMVVYSGMRPGYGNTVLVEHDNGLITLYGHNSRLLVAAGEQVNSGAAIALSGNTGRSTGPHLHFEAWQSGVNVTAALMPGNAVPLPNLKLASHKPKISFRKEIMSDGSILFTNIPSSIP